MAYIPESGSVVAFQTNPSVLQTLTGLMSTNASVITVGTAAANQSVSGTIGASVIGHAPVVIVGGSILTSATANQSVSGAVSVSNFPTTQNISGSVVAFGFPANQSVSGTVGNTQVGTWVTSLVSTVPSSVIVGASVFGTVPVTQVTSPWLTVPTSGSVIANQGGTRITSLVSTIPSSVLVGNYGHRNDALASFLGANLTWRPFATDSAGRTLNKPFAAEEARVEGYHSVVSTSVTTLVAAAGAGLRNYITDVWIANTGATTTLITFKDGAGSILGYTIAPAGGGSNLPGLQTPIRTGANASFDFQPTSASSILYATVKGFKAP